MAKRGPKLTPIDWKLFDQLCNIQCTLQEIAGIFKCSEDTIERAVVREKNMKFADYYKIASAEGKKSLRRKQFQVALERGNTAMLIWLGKQYLNQKDKTEFSGNENQPISLAYATTEPLS